MKTYLIGAAGLLLSVTASPAAIVTNGSFESGSFLPGWTVSGSGITPGTGPRVVTTNGVADSTGYGDVVPSYDGNYAAYFVDDLAAESISQTVSLIGGTSYNLAFALFATVSGERNPFSFTLTDDVGGLLLNSFSNGSGMTDVPVGVWTPQSASFFVGGTGDYTLSFNFSAGPTPARDVLLDAVSIIPSTVPLPASAPMLGTALVVLGAFGYAAKRKRAVMAA